MSSFPLVFAPDGIRFVCLRIFITFFHVFPICPYVNEQSPKSWNLLVINLNTKFGGCFSGYSLKVGG